MHRILVADKIAEPGLERLRSAPGVEFDVKHGLSPEDLAKTVGQYDGMLIRSAVKVTADTLANPGKLSAIARAGVGVDNIDLEAATAAGVLVLNTPDANTVSTAEHTIALMLALHHRIPSAHAHVTGGGWKRNEYLGRQLAGRTLGIVGLGRIGRAVAQRALALEMKVIAFDPFVRGETALDGNVTLVGELKDLFAASDCLTLHASLTSDTKHLINDEQIARMKKGACIVNCARGALIDEAALAKALNEDRLGGAAIDVYQNEPPADSPLLSAKNVVLTPHLAASTAEAQQRVSVDAVDTLLAYLLNGEIRSAVNVSGMPKHLSDHDRSYVDLCARMATMLSTWSAEGVEQITLTTHGEALAELSETLSWQAMVSVLSPHLDARLNLVNAREHAESRGIAVQSNNAANANDPSFPESIVLEVKCRGDAHKIEGTVFSDGRPRVTSVDGYKMDLIPERCMALIFNDDKPGVIGLVGQAFGEAKINIADMALSRRGKMALMVLKLDGPMPDELRDKLRGMNPPILSLEIVSLPPVTDGSTGE